MPQPKKNRERSVLPVFRIFCEGEKTEPLYIKGYVSHFHSEKRNIIVVEDTNKNTPVQLVDVAVEAKKNGNINDVVWVVFDRESEAKYPNHLHEEARSKADANDIEIAFSNVCFELWLLLHFSYSTASYNSCDELLRQSKLKDELKKIGVDNYDKGLATLFEKLKDKVPIAIKNATKLKEYACDSAPTGKPVPHKINPYIDVHELFLDMQNFISSKPSIRL